jgi:L-histidine N-alpha-methyltransferase
VAMVEIQGSYTEGLRQVVARRNHGESLLVLFLGSTIGNFERGPADYFLRQVRALLLPGDALLLGADLVKPVPQLLAAYDDSIGVTAAFNLNLLARINRELDGDFDLSRFRHEARYNPAERRVEMHLESLVAQTVMIRRANLRLDLQAGESIWTESSHKYDLDELRQIARRAGFVCERQWTDEEWPFAESLFRVEPA